MKLRKAVTVLLFLFSFLEVYAQDIIVKDDVETVSYTLYQKKDWKELIRYGKNVLEKGTDYFYLRMRIGIAYYERKNYSLAEGHFKKALEFSTGDQLALEYLYYCYIFTGQTEQAILLSRQFSKELLMKTGTEKNSSVDLILIEGGIKKSDSASYYDVHKGGYSNYFNPAKYFQLGVDHYMNKRVSLFHAITYFNQESFTGTLLQYQYYVAGAIPLKKDWVLSPALHGIHLLFTPKAPSGASGGAVKANASNYFVGSLAVQKNCGKFVISLGSTVSNVFTKTQYIHMGQLSVLPLGNTRLMVGCAAYIHTLDNYSTVNGSLSPFVVVQPISGISLKASYLLNKGNNIIEENGYLVNNCRDLTTSRGSVLATFRVQKHIALYALYQREHKTEAVQQFNYSYHVFLGGIKIMP